LWNPYLFAGMPFVCDIQSGIFYPLNLLAFFLSDPFTLRDMEYLSVLHFAIAGIGMYAFLRWGEWKLESTSNLQPLTSNIQSLTSNFNLSRLACLAGAMAFEFSDLFITHFGNLNLIAASAWMPIILLFYRRAVLDQRAGFAILSGIFLALAFLAGHAQAFLFSVIALGLMAAYHIADGRWQIAELSLRGAAQKNQHREQDKLPSIFEKANERAKATKQSPLSVLGIASSLRSAPLLAMTFAILTALVAFGLAAPILFPVAEFSQLTTRAAYSYAQAAEFSLPPAQLIGLFVPGFFGRGPQNAWGPWQRVEVGYIGILPILLALLAIILRRDAPTRFFGIVALIGLALALGGYSILHGWLYQFVPGFGQLRAPARFIFLFDFALAALAALGFDFLLHALPRASEIIFKRVARSLPWIFLLVALAAGATAYAILILGQGQDAILFQRIANAANALAFFILLFGLSVPLIVARATRFFRARVWSIAALALIFFDLFSLGANVDSGADDPMRAYAHPDAIAFLKSDGNFFRVDPIGTGVENLWQPDTSILYNFFDVGGDNPLVLADFDRYWQSLGSRSSALYDLLNVKYLIGRKNISLDRAKFRVAYDGDPALNVYENTRVLPRAFIVNEARVVANRAEAWDAIHAADFDPSRVVILEGMTVDRRPSTVGDGAKVKIVGYGPNEIMLETNSARAGYLVLSEIYFPGWRAWIDDREVAVSRANYLFRAIELPAGAQRVRFLYDPLSYKVGLGFFFAIGIWRLRKSRMKTVL
ncbi:MAG: YfhO family protein, partial [Chloroflexi bacterium]|nr:YfhO family protein [Chloroflexota bacterium]